MRIRLFLQHPLWMGLLWMWPRICESVGNLQTGEKGTHRKNTSTLKMNPNNEFGNEPMYEPFRVANPWKGAQRLLEPMYDSPGRVCGSRAWEKIYWGFEMWLNCRMSNQGCQLGVQVFRLDLQVFRFCQARYNMADVSGRSELNLEIAQLSRHLQLQPQLIPLVVNPMNFMKPK